jgi:phosphoribosylformylglycinamidine cyclo-ligase
MPDIYARGDYDLAGFCVGVVEREKVIDGKQIAAGDAVIGVASSGLHSNGYSLVRKIAFEIGKFKPGDIVDELAGARTGTATNGAANSATGVTVGEVLLTPTQIYAKAVRKILTHYTVKEVVHGIAHITGGGLLENLGRIIPEGRQAIVQRNSWPVPPVFNWLQKIGEVEQTEMDEVFNMGIGLAFVVSPYYADSIHDQLHDCGLASWPIGRIAEGPKGAVWE